MPNPTNELSQLPPTEASPETPTAPLKAKPLNESLDEANENEPVCDLSFKEQCQIVWDGIKKGVKYDGCSGVPDFNFGSDCCGEHDYHYQLSDVSKWEADKRLRECILKKGYPLIAWSYWIGVTILGWKFYKRKQNEIFPLADNRDAG